MLSLVVTKQFFEHYLQITVMLSKVATNQDTLQKYTQIRVPEQRGNKNDV